MAVGNPVVLTISLDGGLWSYTGINGIRNTLINIGWAGDLQE